MVLEDVHDYDLGANEGPRIVATAGSFIAAITLTMIVRLYVRTKMVGSVGADDWTILLATCISIAMSAVSIVEVQYGAGRHMLAIPPPDFTYGMMLNFITQVLALSAAALVKMSICLFLLRLAIEPLYRRICYGILIFTGAYTIAGTIAMSYQCTPLSHFWDKRVEGNCMSSDSLIAIVYTISVLGIMTDFFLVVLPVPMVWNVKIPKRQKAILCLILGLGAFSSTASIVKMTYNINYGKIGGDFLWDSTYLTIWSILEIDIGIITASMPALKPLFKHVLEKTGYSSGLRRTSLSNSHPLQSLHTLRVTNDICANAKKNSDSVLNDSEESIFAQASNMGGITKSTEVRLDIEQLGDECSFENKDVSVGITVE
ncbi:hypothetical protein RUND412_008082 [Rhizina undulata]